MPSGKFHALATTVTAGIGGSMMVLLGGQPTAYGVAFVAGCMTGLLVNPDLDMHHDTRSHALVRSSAGCLVGTAWHIFWLPYARLIPRHRHWISHLPVLSTLVRVVYMLAIPAALYWAITYFLPIPALTFPQFRTFFTWALAGLMIVDGIHTIMDWIIH